MIYIYYKKTLVECNSIESSVVTSSPPPPPPPIASKPPPATIQMQATKANESCSTKPDKPARPGSHHRNKDVQNDQTELIKELSKSMTCRIPKTEG